jgi:methylphosphotriester-DNA--protein-cysteine methyltransferase
MFWQIAYICLLLYLLFDQYEVIMNKYFFSRQEIAAELGIDPKTLNRKLQKAGIMLQKGMIPAEKVREIMNLLQVKQENLDGTEQIEQPD